MLWADPSRRPAAVRREEVIVSLIIGFALCVALGASVALASRGILASEGLLRAPGLWALVAMQALVFVPVTAYVLHRFPDWSLLYLVDATQLGEPAVLASVFPIAALGAFGGARKLLLKGRLPLVVLILAAALVIAALVIYIARGPLQVVGSRVIFQQGSGKLRPIVETTLVYLLAGGGVLILASWFMTVWRLALVSLAASRQLEAQTKRSLRRPTGDTAPRRRK